MSIEDFDIVHKDMKRFMRIAMAQQRASYPYPPQRRAICAKMYVRWCSRKYHQSDEYVNNIW